MLAMDTSDIPKPFKSKPFDGKLDVYARSFVLLQELAEGQTRPSMAEAQAEPVTVPAATEAVASAGAASSPEIGIESGPEPAPLEAEPVEEPEIAG